MTDKQKISGIIGFDKLKECIVTDQETNSEKPCSFPFIINDKIYYGCTTDFVETQNLACSTKTNTEDAHIEGELANYMIFFEFLT